MVRTRLGRPPYRSIACAWLLGLALAACGADRPDATMEVGAVVEASDDAGRVVRLASPPTRVISLVPSVTGILLSLGAGDLLVGRTDYDEDPRVRDVPSVGGGLAPSMERIVSLRPDLVVRFRADSDPATARQLDQAGIAHAAVRPDRIEDVLRIVRLLGTLTARDTAADSLVRMLEGRVAEISAAVSGLARPKVAFLLGGDPPLVAGGDTFLHELIEIAGGENAFAELESLYAPVNVEEVIRRTPDVLIAREGAQIPAALGRIRIVRVPGHVESPGIELADSALLLARALHPDRFP